MSDFSVSLLQYQMEASFLEIYNETIRDLLGNNTDDMKHEIKMVANNSQETMVTNLTTVAVKKQEQVGIKIIIFFFFYNQECLWF